MVRVTPFEVDPQEITRLGGSFTTFVNSLLAAEAARAGLTGTQLRTDEQNDTADGGVDAALTHGAASQWIPPGPSVWQFKRSDLAPARCESELLGAKWAHHRIQEGAKYYLVLGAPLGDRKIQKRLDSLWKAARRLGFDADSAEIEVLDANQLAVWASMFPAVSQLPLFGPQMGGLKSIEEWTRSGGHPEGWVPVSVRTGLLDEIRADLQRPEVGNVRVQGPQGIGKSRLVMEAVRGSEQLGPLAVYVDSVDGADPQVVNYLTRQSKSAILIVDECGNREHEKLVERLSNSSGLKLLTIGEQSPYTLQGSTPIFVPELFTDEDVKQFIGSNHPTVWPEAAQFIVTFAGGNPRWIRLMCRAVVEQGVSGVGELIARGDIEEFISKISPQGSDFSLSAILALCGRVGWDREKAEQLERLAEFAGVLPVELRRVGDDLERRGFVSRQGRYRSITPLPFAVGLAARIWNQEGRRVIDELVPILDAEMAESFFKRLSELGTYAPAQAELERLLVNDEELGTLEGIERRGMKQFLVNSAIVAPRRTLEHIARLIDDRSTEDLVSSSGIRRELVWTLEKLVWHSALFEASADRILRLAVAENERYANNARGLWKSLFSPHLPATAAPPDARLTYLKEVTVRGKHEKLLSVEACKDGMRPGGSVAVSGELQGGSVVEPRGGVSTLQEYEDFRQSLLQLLYQLAIDDDVEVSQAAFDAFVAVALMVLGNPRLSETFQTISLRFSRERQADVRRAIVKFSEIGRRGSERIADNVSELISRLPEPDSLERVQDLGSLHPWDYRDGALLPELRSALEGVIRDQQLPDLVSWLVTSSVPSSWQIGRELGRVTALSESMLFFLSANVGALGGALQGKVDEGDSGAFEAFLSSASAGELLTARERLELAVRAPHSEKSREIVLSLASSLRPAEAISAIFVWRDHLSDDELGQLLGELRSKVQDQADYDSIVDWAHMLLEDRDDLSAALEAEAWQVTLMRQNYPDIGRRDYDWARLASRFVDTHFDALNDLIIKLMTEDSLILHPGDSDGEILVACAKRAPEASWARIGEELRVMNWRVSMSLKEWYTPKIPLETIERWINGDTEAARVTALIASVEDGEHISGLAKFLLDNFAQDEVVASTLAGTFVSGSWNGRWSVRIQKQIDDVERWQRLYEDSPGVARWTRELLLDLRRQLPETIEREEERGY